MSRTVVAVELVGGEAVDLLDRAEDVRGAHDLVAAFNRSEHQPQGSGEHRDMASKRLDMGLIKDLQAKAGFLFLCVIAGKQGVYLWMISFSNTVPNTSPPAITCKEDTTCLIRQTPRIIQKESQRGRRSKA